MTGEIVHMALPPQIEAYPGLEKLLAYCRGLAQDRELPRKSDFRPSQIRWLFGHIYLVDVLQDDYRCRLWGLFWETIFGYDLLGKRLSDLERAGHVLSLRAEYDAVVAARQPRFRVGRVVWPDDTSISYARVIVPFADDQGRISMLLSAATSDKSLEDLVFFKGLGTPGFLYETLPGAVAA